MRAVMKNMKQAQCAEPANVSQEAVKEPAFYWEISFWKATGPERIFAQKRSGTPFLFFDQ